MARRKVTCALQLENWQQADDVLRQIGEDRRDLAAIENVMNERIADAKADAEAKGRPIKDHIAMLDRRCASLRRCTGQTSAKPRAGRSRLARSGSDRAPA